MEGRQEDMSADKEAVLVADLINSIGCSPRESLM